MSVLIKGMEMPEHCGYCRFRYDGICHALKKTQYNKEDCPLVPVPTHGDLIDRDALLSTENQHYALREDDWYVTTRRVELMPTIIPAEGE